jgi:hypothetical protein
MKRNLLAAAAAPLLVASAPALAQVTISTSTSTPVQTATANNGAPSDVIVSGSIGLTTAGTASAPVSALTLNSNNNVNITGTLGATSLNYTNGLTILGGYTGSALNQGAIDITESYTPPVDPNNNGLYTGLFAQGSNRIGLQVIGSGVFTGNNQSVTATDGTIIVNGVTNIGTITVNGNNSEGVYIAAPIVGNFLSIGCFNCTTTNASTTPSTAPIVATGSITVTGQQAIGFEMTSTGGISGNLRLGAVSATGPGAQAVLLNGNVGGYFDLSGTATATGYRTTTRQTNPYIAALYSQMEMQQGGSAVTIGGSVGNGVIVSAPPPDAGTGTEYSSNTYLNTNGQNLSGLLIPDILQGAGAAISYGAAPAMQVGSATGAAITIGTYSASNYLSIYNGNVGVPKTGQFGLVNQGSILGEGLFDQLTTPYLLAPVSATALQIGGQILINPQILGFNTGYQPDPTNTNLQSPVAASYGTSGAVNIAGGVYNSGTIAAYSYQANATAIHLGAGASTPELYNDGAIFASSTQVNSALTVTVYPGYGANAPITETVTPVNVTAIQIDAGATLTTITNNSGILAELTGSSSTAGPSAGGVTRAIMDNSGTLATVNNTGSITALLNQTDVSELMPINTATIACQTCAPTATSVAIDMQYGKGPEVINQSAVVLPSGITPTAYVSTSAYTTLNTVVSYLGNYYVNVAEAGAGYDPIDYPTYWREIGAVSPSITGDIYMGSGNDTMNIQAGTVSSSNIWMGAGTNTINVGTSASSATIAGSITETATGTNGTGFVFNVVNGTLADYNPALNQAAQTINVASTGVLTVAVDPLNNRNTQFNVLGSANIASGGQIGLYMVSLQIPLTQTYTIMYGAPGSITAPALGATAIGNSPFLYTATATYVASSPTSTATGAAPAGDSAIDLTVTRKTAAELGFNAAEAAAYDPILTALEQATPTNQGIQQALLAQTSEASFKSIYDQLLPNQGQGIFQALDAAVEKVSGFTQTPPDNATTMGGQSLWLQEVNERVDRSGLDTLGSDAQILGLVGGYERMGAGGGAIGVTLGYYNASENSTAAQLGARDIASLVEGSVYYRRQDGPLTIGARIGGGYGWFSETRVFAYGSSIYQANGAWTGAFIDAHLGASYEIKLFGPYYARPEVSIDYLRLAEAGYQESGTNSAFDLKVAPQTDTQLTAQGLMVFGRQWGKGSWFRSEIRMGWREVIDGSVGDTTASFDGGTPFEMLGDPDRGGWATVGFSLKTGSQFSYLALEGDADLRKGQQRYDLRVAGRSVF